MCRKTLENWPAHLLFGWFKPGFSFSHSRQSNDDAASQRVPNPRNNQWSKMGYRTSMDPETHSNVLENWMTPSKLFTKFMDKTCISRPKVTWFMKLGIAVFGPRFMGWNVISDSILWWMEIHRLFQLRMFYQFHGDGKLFPYSSDCVASDIATTESLTIFLPNCQNVSFHLSST